MARGKWLAPPGGNRSFVGAERGVSPVVAIVLLIGIAAVGALMLAVVGTAMFEGLEEQSERERALAVADEMDYRFSTLLHSDGSAELPLEDAVLHPDDGAIEVTFHDDDPALEDETIEVEPLGAVEYPVGDQSVVLQGGGVFVVEADGATVRSAPPIAYENEDLDLAILQLDMDERAGGIATADFAEGQAVANELDAAAAHGHENVTLQIDSAFHRAWAAHLERTMNASDENVSVEHDPDAERVTVSIEHFRTHTDHVTVTDLEVPELLAHNEDAELEATVTNEGGASVQDAPVELHIEHDDETFATEETVSLEPGESTTVSFEIDSGEIPGRVNQWQALDQYGEREVSVSTPDGDATSGFVLVAHKPTYQIESDGHEIEGNRSVVSLEVRNVGIENDSADAAFDITTDDADFASVLDPIEWGEEPLQLEPWESGTATFEINRSMLPDANYSYDVTLDQPKAEAPCEGPQGDPAWCERSGEFEIAGGAVGDVGEIIIEEPSAFNISIIGTEISWEDCSGATCDKKYWAPVTASAVVNDTRYRFMPDGSMEEIPLDEPHYTAPGESMGDFDLNTYDTQEKVYEFDGEIQEGTMTIESTYWACQSALDEYHVATTTVPGHGQVDHYDCPDEELIDPITIDIAGDSADVDDGFVMTRDQDRNELPDIEKGYPMQRSIADVFDDGTDDVELVDGELTLGSGDFAFMMEVTMDRAELDEEYNPNRDCVSEYEGYTGEYSHVFDTENQTLWNLAAWDIGQHYRDEACSNVDGNWWTSTGDPNFNDVIGFVQVDAGETDVDFDPDHLLTYTAPDGEVVLPGADYDFEEYEPEGGEVDPGVGYIVIS